MRCLHVAGHRHEERRAHRRGNTSEDNRGAVRSGRVRVRVAFERERERDGSRFLCIFLSSFRIISDCDGGDEDRVAVHRHGSTGAEARLVQCEFLAGRFFVMAKQDVTRKYATCHF